jgi:hypothetical protein
MSAGMKSSNKPSIINLKLNSYQKMVQINNRPHKKSEHYSGKIIMAFPNMENVEWEFELVRTTNGVVKDQIIFPETEALQRLGKTERDCMTRTILECIKRQKIDQTELENTH